MRKARMKQRVANARVQSLQKIAKNHEMPIGAGRRMRFVLANERKVNHAGTSVKGPKQMRQMVKSAKRASKGKRV